MRISDWSSDVCSSDLPTMERSSKAECWEQAQDAETETGSRQLLAVDGLICGGCARGLEQRLRKLEGVVDAGVHYLTADRKSVVKGQSVSGRVAVGGGRISKKKRKKKKKSRKDD